MTRKKFILLAPVFLAGFALLIVICGEIVRQLWNWLTPALFGWPVITFWQALGLLVLCRILFGLGGRGSHSSRAGHRMGERVGDRMADRIVDRVAERLDRMTPEEKERFRQRIR